MDSKQAPSLSESMDSKQAPSLSDLVDSKEAASLSGSPPVSSDNTGSKVKDNSNNRSGSSDDGNEGFASGEEALGTALEDNVVLGGVENVDEGESFLEPSEFPVAKVGNDGDEKLVVQGGKVEGEVGLVDKGSGASASDEKVMVKEPVSNKSEGDKMGESGEGVVDKVESSNRGSSVGEKVGEDVGLVEKGSGLTGVDKKPELEKNLNSSEDVMERVLEGSERDKVGESKEMIESLNREDSVTAPKEITSDEANSGVPERGNKVVETTEADSIAEATQVDNPAPGAAVVMNTDEDEDEDEGVVLVGGPDDTSLVEANSVKLTSEGDSVVEAVDVGLPLPGVAGVAVVTKTEEDGDTINDSGSSEKMDHVLEEMVDKEVVVTDSKFAPLDVEASVGYDVEKKEKYLEEEIEKGVYYEGKENGTVVKTAVDDVEVASKVGLEGDEIQATKQLDEGKANDAAAEAKHMDTGAVPLSVKDNGLENGPADKFVLEESAEKDDADEEAYMDGSPTDEDTDGMIFGSSDAAKEFIEELERGSGGGGDSNIGGESSQDRSQIDGQIVTDSDEEDEEDGKELFDSAALAALLKAAADGGSEGGNITISSQDGSRLFTVERPAGLGSSLQSMRPAPRPTRTNFLNSSSLVSGGETDSNLSEEERKKLEKLQSIRVKFLRLVQRLGLSSDESVAAQVLYRLALIAGRQTGQSFSLDAARRKAAELEAEGKDDLDFSVNILVIGKSGVGKSATINSIFGEDKSVINAFQPATATVKEIHGVVDGVKIRVIDTPGLKSSVMDQGFNRSILSSAKKLTKRNPLDVVLYVDRLDAQTRDLNDLPLLRTITSSLGSSIWRSVIVTLTHGASAPPEGPSGSPLSYEMFVTQRSHVVQQGIGQAVGDLRMMSPSLMNPVSLVENHRSCRKNREGQKVLPNGQTWKPQLLMLCYSMKILSEANSLSKPHDPYDHRKLFGFRGRSPPLPYMLSSMLQSRAHPKLSTEQGGDGGDSDVDLAELSDSELEEEEDEYDQLPPFKPLKKSQLAKLSKEQRNAYFDEYDYRVKLLQKKQWKEEVKRMKEMKKGKDGVHDSTQVEEEGDGGAPAPVAVPLPDMVLPPSFDSDNPAYRFRFLEPTSQFLARPVLDTHGWDHDCGYDGVNVEQSLAIASRYPASISVQVTKDKKDFSINLDSSISAKHGERGSSMAGFDIQPIGKQLAYIVRGETKFKNFKKNKTAAGMSVTFMGENVVTGFKVEDQIAFGRQYSLVASAGTVKAQNDSAYGANIEVQRRELDYPVGQVQSTFGLSIIKWRGDLALGFNSLAQFSAGRNSKVAVRAGINNKMSGQITVKTSSSEHLSLALAAVIPYAIAAYKKLSSGTGEKFPTY